MKITAYLLSAFISVSPAVASTNQFVGLCTIEHYRAGTLTMHDLAINILSAPHEDVVYVITKCTREDPSRIVPMETLGEDINSSATSLTSFAKRTLENPNRAFQNQTPAPSE